MSGTTISGTYLSSITLSNAATQNPATVTAGSTLGGGLVGTSGTYWTISNSGVINNSATGTTGISLAGGGDVSNTSNATITGASYGIVLGEGGMITNATGASIGGGFDAVRISGAVGTVINSGAVVTTQTTSGVAVYLAASGAVTNAASASIKGGLDGVEIAGMSAEVVNSGIIAGINNTASIGVFLNGGGALTNAAGATVTAGRFGVEVLGGAGTILNNGTIAATEVTPTLTTLHSAIYLGAAGTITNSLSGLIQGQTGIYANNGFLTVANFGMIAGTSSASGSIVGIAGRAGVDLFVTNAASGLITGQSFGIDVGRGTGTIINAGSIYGRQKGVDADYVYNERDATIRASGVGVDSYNRYNDRPGRVGVTITNAGTIAGNYDSIRLDSGYVTNLGTGLISAGGTGAVSVAAGGIVDFGVGTVMNYGAITTDNSITSKKFGVYFRNGGYVLNAASASIVGGSGIYAGKIGTIINSGSILGSSTVGAGVALEAGGFLTNTADGVLTGGDNAVRANGWIVLNNAGAIIGNHNGVFLQAGGSVVNAASASISAAGVGIESGGALSLLNSGVITGYDTGIRLATKGEITNTAAAEISGGLYGIRLGDGGTIVNSGTVMVTSDALHGVAVGLLNGGTVLNAASATIESRNIGIAVEGGVATIANSGSIAGAGGAGIAVMDGLRPTLGMIVNSGLIQGATVGISLAAGGTITNAGTIVGLGGRAIDSNSTGALRIVVDPGAVFDGNVVGSTSGSNTLELASGAGTGTISGIGTSFANFVSLLVDIGARWELTGANSLASGSTLTNNGTLSMSAATLSDAGGVINDGRIELDPSTLSVASLSGTGTVTIDAGSTLAVQGAVSSGQDIVFAGSGGELDLASPSAFSGTISGFADGDIIDLTSVVDVAGSHADMNYSTNVLTVTEGSAVYHFQFDKAESFAGDFFHLIAQDGGTLIEENQIACYRRGTLIATDRGEVAVETLGIGDLVVTASGAQRPIKWIGRRSYGGRFILGRSDILPVCFKAGSLDDDLPRRDLFVSPHHAMYLEGVLIEAKDLINGVSIVQAEQIDQIDYFHVELETHDVILAEGAPSETFVDDDSRSMFHNAHDYAALYPDGDGKPVRYCAPRLDIGYEVEAVRQRLARRAGLDVVPGATGALRGFIDAAGEHGIEGWAQHVHYPETPVCLDILARGGLIGRVLANSDRADLRCAGIGSGRHGFNFVLPPGVSPEEIEIRRALDGAPLPWSAAARRQPRRSRAV